MPSDEVQLREADQIIDELRRAIHHGFGDVNAAKTMLRLVLKQDMWTDRVINATDRRQKYDKFIRFVADPPLEGLGTTTDTLKALASGDTELEDLLTRALNRGRGRPTKNLNNVKVYESEYPEGNTATAALRRLYKDRRDLHDRVIAGEMSPHAAMVEAGFREKALTVPLDVERAAATLRRHFTADERAQLAELLMDGDD